MIPAAQRDEARPRDHALPPPRYRRLGWWLAAGLAAGAAAALFAAWAAGAFGGRAAADGPFTGAASVGLATVTRGTLASQVRQNGTLGFAGSYSVIGQARGIITSLPAAGQVIRQGQPLYQVNGTPVVLLYGAAPAYRPLAEGDSGRDVAQLNSDLIRLGYAERAAAGADSDQYTAATAAAVAKLQAALGLPQTGTLPLGTVVFEPEAVRVASAAAPLGGAAAPGRVILQATSTTPEVTVSLDASLQTEVRTGDTVTIVLPDNATTTGTVSSVGTVATAPPAGSGGAAGSGGSPATVPVFITLDHPSAAGGLDQAPVQVTITSQTVTNALAVPVTALVATVGGGYTVEAVDAGGRHTLVPVTLGIFDDAAGLVQVSGNLRAGERIVTAQT